MSHGSAKEVISMSTTTYSIVLKLSEWYIFLLAGWYLSKWYYEAKREEQKPLPKK